jgi:CspA family cold shock protein
LTGTIKFFNATKGWGFIKPDDGSPDVFVHYERIAGEGFKTFGRKQRVSYEAEPGPKGPRATRVERVY